MPLAICVSGGLAWLPFQPLRASNAGATGKMGDDIGSLSLESESEVGIRGPIPTQTSDSDSDSDFRFRFAEVCLG
jgi:hypothetical protein